jgi:hypothetical protein|tara:strand:+ start:12487 stop:13146 length:660 start_codon:yes stop_codon:yes gene_type:complete
MKHKTPIILAIMSLAACTKLKDAPAELPHYYPLALNDYSTFAIEELQHDAFREETDTIYYWLKETVADTVRDNTGQLAYTIEIEQSNDSGRTWEFITYGLAHKDNFSAQRMVNNKRTVVLSFPLRERKSWDINELNIEDMKTARYFDVDQAYTLVGVAYSNSLRVDLGNDVDPFFQEVEEEIYARGKGLIWRKKLSVETQPGKYKEGNEFTQTIIRTNR